jgi:opacity protein-like surface antigen
MRSMGMVRMSVLVLLLLVGPANVSAQKHEVAGLLGGMSTGDKHFTLPSPGSLQIGNGLTYQLNYAHRILDAKLAAVYLELPLAVTPNTDINSSNLLVPRNYGALFITPGLKLRLLPLGGFSPYGVLGAGYARFSESSTLLNGQTNTATQGTNRVAIDYGGGLDVRVLPHLSLRGEIRDFYSGTPHFNTSLTEGNQHNVLVSGGVVLRF